MYFADGDGNRVEPNGRVRVTFEYKTPAAPELTDAASTSVTVEKLHYNSSTGDTDVNTLQANEDLKVLNVNEGKQIQTLQVETGNAAVFAVMWDSPETADVEAEAVSGNEDEVPIASEELTDGMDISDEPEQDAAETPAAENPEVTPEAEPSEAPAENPDAEPTEAPAEDPDVVEEPAEDIASPEDVPAADENGETSLIEVLGDDTNLRVSPSVEAEVLATVNAGTQLTLLDTVTAEDGATWYKVSWEGTEAYIRSDMAQVVDSSDEAEEPEDVLESEEVSYSQEVGNVVVTATAAKGVIPEGAQFVVTPIEKGSDQYADIEKQLHEGAENESYTVAGFLAYDISFLNDDGTKIEPQNGSVRVSIAYKEAEIPEDVAETDTAQENMNVSLVHFVEDANGNVTEVVNMSNDGQAEVSTTDNGEIESANFETESFSTFSVVWLADDFTSVQTTSSYGVEETVDSAKRGITINMFNYNTDEINAGHSLQFSNGKDGGWEDYNRYRGPEDLSLGIMQKRLGADSYPMVDKGNKESSSYLFSTEAGTGKEVYPGANHLFKKDADGYYEYDSTKNFAQFNTETKNFTVYKVPGSSTDPIDLQQGSKHGSFFPFNTLGDHKYWDIPQISEKSPDFHFGMTMSAKFIQPKDGKINDNNMVFEFSGDDDVWVYIDGVLVLDIGGIHNAVSGSINFADGKVTFGNNNTDLKTLFKNANREGDFVSGKSIFKDYTAHTINFYYLERGKGDSNCKLKFNLPTVPKKSVTVEKADGKTKIEKDTSDSLYHIMNYTQQEIIESSMDYSKTATVNDWDKRIYDINITASSKTTSSSVVTTGGVADVVMALDVSGSMRYTQTAGDTETGYVSVGKYNSIRNSLKPNKIYYYKKKYPMINVGNKWMYYYTGLFGSYWQEIGDSDDTKIYQWPSRITALKEVVNQFIRNTATSSSESNIGLAPFNTAVTNATETLLNVDKNKDTLIKNVSQLSVTGGTSPDTALNKALELLNNAKNPKYVILFTDGEPTGPSDKWDKNYQQKAETAAKSLKDKGIKVFTVGFALSERGQKFLAGDEKDSKNYPGIASEGCAFNATNAEDLAKIFEKIQHTVTEDTAIQNATVTDVIDPRFVILDKEGNAITADQLKDGKTVQVKDGTVYLDAKGNQCIKWERQRIPNKKENKAGDACWSRSIKVKAKDDYIGGNNVPTNVSPDSKISTGYGDAILPQPTVNVKADLTVDNLEKVIFLGDPTPTADLPDSMLSSILQKSKNYVYNETTKELEPVRVTRDDLTCSWAKDETFGNDELTDLESMAGDHPTEDPTRYYLKVTYNAGEPTETVGKKPGSTANTDGHIAGGETHIVTAINSDTKNYPDKEYGVYTIHIIKGQIQITKKLEDVAKKDGTFTFNIYKGSADESNLVTIVTATVKAGNTDAKFTMGNNESEKAIVAGLARGEYIVQEVSKSGYQLLNASNDSKVTNCKSEESEDIKFTIGTDNDNKNALEAEALNVGSVDYANYAGPGCVGKVDYTNKETVANVDFVKVDAADNNITINGAMFKLYKADESWTKGEEVKAVTSENGGTFGFEKLLPGNYLLNETKAATGYSLVTEPWKIVIKNNGEVTVTKNDGKTVIVKNSDERYKIENAKVYSLPESGGPGTYGFTISGVAILATALLLFINNKRREEEAKRS